jgi:DNA-binding response OmpR family regulator
LTVGNFESIAPQKQITFSFDYQMKKTAKILLDKDKFEHVIYNYLSNAFKYTPKGGEVGVEVKEVDNKIRLAVKDSGVGIPEVDIPNLFNRFFQAGNAQKAGSSGIGLALCREIAELLGGRVWAESVVGKGSTFYFEMPYKEFIGIIEKPVVGSEQLAISRQLVVGNEQSVERLAEKDHTILLTEDNPELRDYISTILSEHYNVIAAENGKEALDLLPTVNCQLIISDIMMPVMDGLELLDNIKKLEKYRHIPMIMLTARQSMEARMSALQLGVDDYITKPFDEDELLIRIKNILTNQKARINFIQQENEVATSADETKEKLTITLTENDVEWLQQLEEVVNKNLMNADFTAISCAEALHISKRQLSRRVKKCTGLGTGQYIRLARLRYARQLLENGQVSTVAETAYQSGFETPAHFARIFYQEFGKKPIDYF